MNFAFTAPSKPCQLTGLAELDGEPRTDYRHVIMLSVEVAVLLSRHNPELSSRRPGTPIRAPVALCYVFDALATKGCAMQLGMIGLGRMGANIVRRLMRNGHECVVFDVNRDFVAALEGEGATGAITMEEFVGKLTKPRVCWVMIPAGITGKIVEQLAEILDEGDIIIDGGNSNYRDDVRRAAKLREQGIHYVDIGTSGGVFGLERGYCLMVGGDESAIRPSTRSSRPSRPGPARSPGPLVAAVICAGGAGLSALRSFGRRALREDGPQRHRVRHHGRLREGLNILHNADAGITTASTRPRWRRWKSRSTTSSTSTPARSPNCGVADR